MLKMEEYGLSADLNKTKVAVPAEEIAKQKEYTQLARAIVEQRFESAPKAFVHTYGCQGNVAEGEKLQGMLYEMGFDFCNSPENADLVLYNTCAVREHAHDRVFGNVGALKPIKEKNPDMIIVLCGCMTVSSLLLFLFGV